MTKYLQAAQAVFDYIDARQVTTPQGIYWDLSDAFNGDWRYYDDISLYAGSAGILKFLLALYQATEQEDYLTEAKLAGDYLCYRWESHSPMQKAFTPYAFTTGYAGVAFVLDELYTVTKTPRYHQTVQSIAEAIVRDLRPSGDWSGQIGVVADGGTALFLLAIAPRYHVKGLPAALVRFGDRLISQQRHEADGSNYYIGFDLKFVGGPLGKFNTGFPLGPAGVAYTLLKLYEFTGEKRFLAATVGVDKFYQNHSLSKQAIRLPHYLPDDNHMCYVGYCGGPVGTSRYFYEYYRQTGDPAYLTAFNQTIAGLDELGVPTQRSEGYWQTENYCCGTAGVLQFYLGAFLALHDPRMLELAKVTADGLLARAVATDAGIMWQQAFERKRPDNLAFGLGYYDGAAGIGASLLQLHQVESGYFDYQRMVDDPYPQNVASTNFAE